jgi:alpha-glucosidase
MDREVQNMDERQWWQDAVFYQIYPRSFADSNGDGIGDIPGVIARLDYLQDLGVDAVWLSPHFPSPLVDCGYDVSDYTGVAPEYGTMEDFDRLLQGLHQRGMRLILDLVLNHTSDQHPWFLESRSSRNNPKRHWYVWRDGKADGPPNNWDSYFGGSAWELDEATGQYYYHFFFKQQPDLNWRNPEVRQAMYAAMRFWLDKGVDGFRLDAIGTIFEDPELSGTRAPVSQAEWYQLSRGENRGADEAWLAKLSLEMYRKQHDLPEIHALMRELRAVIDAYPGRVLVGETDDLAYHGNGQDELHMVFNFPLMKSRRLTPTRIRANQQARLARLPRGAWPCNTLGNHDVSRMMTHFGDGIHDNALARLNLALLMTLKGTPFLYNGEEIGMTDLILDDLDQFRDRIGNWAYQMEVELMHTQPAAAVAYAARASRDKNRTPFQWADLSNGGFSPAGVATWLPVNPTYREGVNLAEQAEDAGSLFHFYREMIRIRKVTPALVRGEYTPLKTQERDYLAFLRTSLPDRQSCLVVLNYADREHHVHLDIGFERARLVFSSRVREKAEDGLSHLVVMPFEVYIGELIAGP